ncbi:MAG: response regulator receiver protein [Verrucomicrobia bacterium]|nr:response regulator receiver protein [Verrucomicrobiota bacterium]
MALRLNLLVAEDDVNDQILMDHVVVKAGLAFVHYAWSGEEVIEYLSGKGPFAARVKYPYPDVLFLDLELPRVNGLQVLEWLDANPSIVRPATYVYTGAKDSPLRQYLERHPIKGFFEKPLNADQVTAILQERVTF